MKKTLIVCSFVVVSIVGASMAVGAGQPAAGADARITPSPDGLPVMPASATGMPPPRAPFDTTAITPMETVGAPSGG